MFPFEPEGLAKSATTAGDAHHAAWDTPPPSGSTRTRDGSESASRKEISSASNSSSRNRSSSISNKVTPKPCNTPQYVVCTQRLSPPEISLPVGRDSCRPS